jgi:hypothetical protein
MGFYVEDAGIQVTKMLITGICEIVSMSLQMGLRFFPDLEVWHY